MKYKKIVYGSEASIAKVEQSSTTEAKGRKEIHGKGRNNQEIDITWKL